MYTALRTYVGGTADSVLIREVSFIERFHCSLVPLWFMSVPTYVTHRNLCMYASPVCTVCVGCVTGCVGSCGERGGVVVVSREYVCADVLCMVCIYSTYVGTLLLCGIVLSVGVWSPKKTQPSQHWSGVGWTC